METVHLLSRSADLINSIDEAIGEPNLPHNPRVTTSAVLCSLGRQHHRAIIRLVERDLPASAAALLRVIFECYVRAVWLHSCASDLEVEGAIDDKWPRLKQMVEAIEANPSLQNGVLMATFDSRWNDFNSFTHNGALALSRQIKDREIRPQFSEEEIRDIVRFSDSISLMIAGHMAVLAKDEKLARALLSKVQAYAQSN